MFGIGFGEFLLLAVLALLVVGPDKLPQFAADAGRFVRQVRQLATSARDEVRESLGPELAELDLRDLDPRTFVDRHLLDDEPPRRSARGDGDDRQRPARPPLRPGERPPYDADAT